MTSSGSYSPLILLPRSTGRVQSFLNLVKARALGKSAKIATRHAPTMRYNP